MTSHSTPLPVGQLTILCIVLLTESICSTMMIPFVGLYVAFMQGWAKESAGYSSGFLIGLFMLGQVISSKLFGIISDKYGRKICIGTGVFFCAVAMFLFGLSSNVWVACVWRFVHGCFAGCSLVAKTMISDVTDKTNQAKGFALVSLTWGVGTLFGPAVGGFLYDPVNKPMLSWMHLKPNGFFARFPAFLPSMVAGMYNLFAVFVCIFFLRETNKQARPLYMLFSPSISEKLKPILFLIQPKLPNNLDENVTIVSNSTIKPEIVQEGEHAEHRSNKHSKSLEELKSEMKGANQCSFDEVRREESKYKTCDLQSTNAKNFESDESKSPSKEKHGHTSFGFKQAFQMPLLRNVCIVSMLISGSDMLYAETFALWGIVSMEAGGLGLDSYQVGILILMNSFPAVIANIYFSKVLHLFNDEMKYWRVCQGIYALMDVVIPVAPYFGANFGFWYTMMWGIIRKVWETWTFCILMMIVAQTAPPGKVGIMYGVQQGTACMVRCLVPFFGAPLFAWSVSGHNIFPFNHFFLFILSAIPLIFSFVLTYKLYVPDDEKYEEHDDVNITNDERERLEEVSEQTINTNNNLPSNTANITLENDEFHTNLPQSNGILSTNASFGNMSRLALTRSRRGSFVLNESSLPLNNSFATLANSFATNMVPGLLQHTIVPPDLNLIIDVNEDDSEADVNPIYESSQSIDRREFNHTIINSLQQNYQFTDINNSDSNNSSNNSNNYNCTAQPQMLNREHLMSELRCAYCEEDRRNNSLEELPTI